MDWDREPFVWVSRRETGTFAALPFLARCLATELLKFADEDGRLYVGNEDVCEAIARRTGATTGDRRLLRTHIPLLIAEGFLTSVGAGWLKLRGAGRSYVKLQKRHTGWSTKAYKAVHKRDGSACRYCGSSSRLTIDHVHPRKQGGSDDAANLAVACRSCNSKKGGRTPEQAGMTLRPLPTSGAR
jgi:hypothetical protein